MRIDEREAASGGGLANSVITSVSRGTRLARPRNADQLHAYIRSMLGFNIPRRPIVHGHNSPFDYVLHTFFEDRRPRDCIVWANRGGGKTQLGAIVTLLDLLFKPGIQVRILGGSFDQSSKMYRYLRRLLEREMFKDLIAGNLTGRHVELVNGSRVEVLSQSERAVRGQRVHRLRCDELELFEPDVWEAAQMVTRSGKCGEVYVHASIETLSTMHRPFGLMQRLVEDAESAGRKVFRWGVLDTLQRCPAERTCAECHIEEDCQGRAKIANGFISIEDACQQRRRVGDETWQAEMLCRKPARGDTVYPEFNPKLHVISADPPGMFRDAARGIWIGGIDFGFRDPTALLWAWLDEHDVLHVIDEFVKSEQTAEKFIEAANTRPWPRPDWIGADPAGRQRSDQTGLSTIAIWKKAGWLVRSRPSRIEYGIRAVRRRLKRADGEVTLRIHQRCRRLIESLMMYHYPPEDPESCTPVKDGHDHAADALRYMVINLDRDDWRVERRNY